MSCQQPQKSTIPNNTNTNKQTTQQNKQHKHKEDAHGNQDHQQVHGQYKGVLEREEGKVGEDGVRHDVDRGLVWVQ